MGREKGSQRRFARTAAPGPVAAIPPLLRRWTATAGEGAGWLRSDSAPATRKRRSPRIPPPIRHGSFAERFPPTAGATAAIPLDRTGAAGPHGRCPAWSTSPPGTAPPDTPPPHVAPVGGLVHVVEGRRPVQKVGPAPRRPPTSRHTGVHDGGEERRSIDHGGVHHLPRPRGARPR